MGTLNISVPNFPAFVRNEFLFDGQHGHGEYTKCMIFGCASIQGKATRFHCLLDNGAQIGRLPISAFCWKTPTPKMPQHHLEVWDAFSYNVSVVEYEWLAGIRCRFFCKDRKWYDAIYQFTIDWYGSRLAEDSTEDGWKCGHVLQMDNGNFAIQPNNRCQWAEPSFVTKPFKKDSLPGYLTNCSDWRNEQYAKWQTEDSGAFFYDESEWDDD